MIVRLDLMLGGLFVVMFLRIMIFGYIKRNIYRGSKREKLVGFLVNWGVLFRFYFEEIMLEGLKIFRVILYIFFLFVSIFVFFN